MTVRELIIAFLGAVAGFDACAVWWLYTLDRERRTFMRGTENQTRWPDRIR